MEYMLSLPFVDGDSKISRVKSWLSKVANQESATSALAASPESLPTLGILRQRTRQRSASHGSDTTLTNFASNAPSQANERILNSSRIDMAIALALRSKQMNQEGNSEDAARLFAVSLEKMSLSLQDLDQIHDSRVRERLNVLRILLTPDTAISLKPYAEWQDAEPVVVPISDRHLHTAKLETMTATLQSTAAYGLDLMNQLFIIWLTLLGNMIVWTSAKFKRSNLPVILAQNLSSITTWCHSVALEWHVYEHALKFGCMLGAWLSYVDKETRFSRKVICSTAAILGAIARVTEQSTNDNPEQNDIK